MPSQLSLSDFNRIASGSYNAGQIDIATAKDGSRSLVKVNNHVWHTSRNTVQLAPERVLEVKEAFIAALRDAGVEETVALAAIREELGMPAGLDATEAGASARAGTLVEKRFTPLTREMVRTILDKYANGGRGFTDQSRASVTQKEDEASLKTAFADDATIARRTAANAKAPSCGDAAEFQRLQDTLSLVFGTKLKDTGAAARSPRELQDASVTLFTQTLMLLRADARESGPGLTLLGTPVKIAKDAAGNVSATLGTGSTAMTVKLANSVQELVDKLIDRAVADCKTLGAGVMKELLNKANTGDYVYQIPPDGPSSLARRLAAKILADHAPRDTAGEPVFRADELIKGSTYSTETLDQLARRALDGESAEVLDSMDVASFLSGGKALADTNAARNHAVGLPNEFKELFLQAHKLSLGHADKSETFTFCGQQASLVTGKDGMLSVVLRKGVNETTVKLGVDASAFVSRLVRCAAGETGTLGSPMVKDLLAKAFSTSARANGDRSTSYNADTLILIAKQGKAESLDSLDELSFLLGERTLTDINAARGQRAGRDPSAETSKLQNCFKELFSKALQLLPAGATESATFTFCGSPAKIVKGGDGNLSVGLGEPPSGMVNLGVDARTFADRLVNCAISEAGTLGGSTMKELLTMALRSDDANQVSHTDPSGLARRFSAEVLAGCARNIASGAPAFTADTLVSGSHSTSVLALFAQRALDGKEIEVLDSMDELLFLSGEKTLADINAARGQRAGRDPGEETSKLQNSFKELFSKALQLLPADATESATFTFCGSPAKIVRGNGGNLSVNLGDPTAATVDLGVDARTFADRLVNCAISEAGTLGGSTMKELLTAAMKSDDANQVSHADPAGLARRLSVKVLEDCARRAAPDAPAFTADQLASRGSYDTGVLAQLAQLALDGEDDKALGTLDALSFLYGEKPLGEINAARGRRVGKDAVEETGKLRNGFRELLSKTLQLPSGGAAHSDDFIFCGTPAQIVQDGAGNLSVTLGTDPAKTAVNLGVHARAFMERLIGIALHESETLGPATVKDILTLVENREVTSLSYDDRGSLTRWFAANILAGYAKDAAFTAGGLISGDYQTMVLAHIAQKALDGEEAEHFNTIDSLGKYHDKLKQDRAGLSEEMMKLLDLVRGVPLNLKNGRFSVNDLGDRAAPARPAEAAATTPADAIAKVAGAAAELKLSDIGGVAAIKDFMADLIFSDETLVAAVTANRPGETMRRNLSDAKKLFAFAQIIRDPTIIDKAVSPDIAEIVKDCFSKMTDILNEKFKTANGETLKDAAKKADFVGRFAAFFMDPAKLPGEELAQFDALILSMSTQGCEKLQEQVNKAFKVNVAAANELGAITSDPYRGKTGNQIAAELKKKSLNDIIDAAATSDAPGQVGLFKQVISNYFMQLRPADKRSAFAASLRYAEPFDFAGKQGDELASAKKAAEDSFTGAILKGAGPILQKMMQGLPKQMMGEFSNVLDDMKAHLAPIPRKIVQAYLMEMINESKQAGLDAKTGHPKKPQITSIRVLNSLGAASVGEVFLCEFNYKDTDGKLKFKNCVVKIMRHDAEARVIEEAKIFTAAAAKIPGMAKTWEGQLRQYMTEFDFRTERDNVEMGLKLYDVKGGGVTVPEPEAATPQEAAVAVDAMKKRLAGYAPNITSMKISPLAPTKKNVMVAEVAYDVTVDAYFKQALTSLRDAAAGVFVMDAATGQIQWAEGPKDPVTQEPTMVPKLQQGVSATALTFLGKKLYSKYEGLREASDYLQQATRIWFYQALLGNGQFHGDAHAGNLMLKCNKGYISFIDFGNLYTLKKDREDGVNEQTELLRVILGAAFRRKEDILTGFEHLMSSDGKAVLANPEIRGKAEKILGEVLAKGSFSANIVYRLQAAVVELQKLGLELPPPINCFILSLARLSNTVTDINMVLDQGRLMLDAADAIKPPPETARDELDLVGRVYDTFARALHPEPESAGFWSWLTGAPKETQAEKDDRIRVALRALENGEYGIRGKKVDDKMFKPGGAYYEAVLKRLNGAAKKPDEVDKLFKLLGQHLPNLSAITQEFANTFAIDVDAFTKLKSTFVGKWKDSLPAGEKEAAIREFVEGYAAMVGRVASKVASGLVGSRFESTTGIVYHMDPPEPFASALMGLIEAELKSFCAPFEEEAKAKEQAKAGAQQVKTPTKRAEATEEEEMSPFQKELQAEMLKELGFGGVRVVSAVFGGAEKVETTLKNDMLNQRGGKGYGRDLKI